MRKSRSQLATDQAAERRHNERVASALRRTEQAPGPDVMPPENVYSSTVGLSIGYYPNGYAGRVDVACTSVAGHSIGRIDRVDLQGSLALYSTRLHALRALRNAMEQRFAEALATVDKQIKEEE